jgi:hypothetical protein
MICDVITKVPVDVLDYDFDFARWLPADDRIVDSVAEISSSTAVVDKIDQADAVARVWISGGDVGDAGTVTVTITTLGGRTKQVQATLKIKEA